MPCRAVDDDCNTSALVHTGSASCGLSATTSCTRCHCRWAQYTRNAAASAVTPPTKIHLTSSSRSSFRGIPAPRQDPRRGETRQKAHDKEGPQAAPEDGAVALQVAAVVIHCWMVSMLMDGMLAAAAGWLVCC